MGMDAHISNTFAALAKKSLPELHAKLAQLAKQPAPNRAADVALIQLLAAAREHIVILEAWANPVAAKPTSAGIADEPPPVEDLDMNDAEAMAMLADMASPLAPKPANEDMDDAEAMAMLAAMDAPLAPQPTGGDMSDAEARAMLEAMDAPLAPKSAGGDMSDAEARAMLEAMDAPVAPKSAGGDMSDAEARAMLEAMDAPVAAPSKAVAQPKPTTMSADDEAMALLASLGGSDADEAPAPASVADEPAEPAHVEEAGEGEHLEEIDEFAKNDFASDPDMLVDFAHAEGRWRHVWFQSHRASHAPHGKFV